MSRVTPLVLCALLCASPGHAQWSKVKQTKDGIAIYTRESPNARVKEVKAETVIDAAPEQVWQSLMDPGTYKSVSKHVEVNTITKTAKESVWYIYQRFAFPMLSKRDYTLRYESFANASAGSYRLVWGVANDRGPAPQRGVVRVTRCGGYFILQPHGDREHTSLVYWLHMDPGGSVPAWIANIANRSSVPDLVRAVRDGALKRRGSKKSAR